MNTVLEMPLRDITPYAIRDLQDKFPSATLRIETEYDAGTKTTIEKRFWKIIAQLDWRTTDTEKILFPAIVALSRCSQNDIKNFHNLLHEKLFMLDAKPFAEALGSNRYTPDGRFSTDSFLYSRCCVVANGEHFFYHVLNNPSKMPKEYTFEALLSLPSQAWFLKTGKNNYVHIPETWCETFSNSEGWNGMLSLKDKILGIL
ncbi:MAG: hypothetical protein RLZZ292_3199 [Bacteroidota bacterium]|jgi:hypothetical protein